MRRAGGRVPGAWPRARRANGTRAAGLKCSGASSLPSEGEVVTLHPHPHPSPPSPPSPPRAPPLPSRSRPPSRRAPLRAPARARNRRFRENERTRRSTPIGRAPTRACALSLGGMGNCQFSVRTHWHCRSISIPFVLTSILHFRFEFALRVCVFFFWYPRRQAPNSHAPSAAKTTELSAQKRCG